MALRVGSGLDVDMKECGSPDLKAPLAPALQRGSQTISMTKALPFFYVQNNHQQPIARVTRGDSKNVRQELPQIAGHTYA